MSRAGLADQRDMARHERSLSSAEAHNKAVKKIVYESHPPGELQRSQQFFLGTGAGLIEICP